MKTTEDLFADDGWLGLYGVVSELDRQNRTKDEIRAIFEALPEDVKNTAHLHGLSDTEFKDEAYVYLRDNPAAYQS